MSMQANQNAAFVMSPSHNHHSSQSLDCDDKNGKNHRVTSILFRVMDIETFDVLHDINLLDHEWCNPVASDRFGRQCHHLELLLLGCLHVSGHDATHKFCESNTQISSECHGKFFLLWCKKMASSIKDSFVSLPGDKVELH
jgi:hypothetical protein